MLVSSAGHATRHAWRSAQSLLLEKHATVASQQLSCMQVPQPGVGKPTPLLLRLHVPLPPPSLSPWGEPAPAVVDAGPLFPHAATKKSAANPVAAAITRNLMAEWLQAPRQQYCARVVRPLQRSRVLTLSLGETVIVQSPKPIKEQPRFPLEVLVVDDDADSLEVVAEAVRKLGHSCRSATDGYRALEMISNRHVDVVISDWTMPGMSGAELCRRTRALSEEAPYTYFVLLTAYADREHLLGGMAAGADDYQTKPVDLDELEARLMSASRVVALHRKLELRTAVLRRDSQRFYLASRTDALTGVGNRLALDEELATAHDRATRYGHRFCLAIADVDDFKDVNDRFGHLHGDDVLRRLAETISTGIRASDRVFRYGGEEFVIVLPQQSLTEACAAMDRLRLQMAGLKHPNDEGVVTMSFGVAELSGQKVDEWLARADAALYSAKRAGRNRVVAG